jgi:hypothetical protein
MSPQLNGEAYQLIVFDKKISRIAKKMLQLEFLMLFQLYN